MKFFYTLTLVLGLFVFTQTQAVAQTQTQKQGTLTPEAFQMMQNNPQASGVLIFESAAIRYNQQVNQNYAQVPQQQRPYVTGPDIARIVDTQIKKYRAGDRDGTFELIAILDVEAPQEEKIAFLEKITKFYLNQ